MGFEDATAAAPEGAPVEPTPEAAPVDPVDQARREREARRGRERRAKARAKELGTPPPSSSAIEPAAPASPRVGPSPERIAKLQATLDKSLKDTAATVEGAIAQLAADNESVPVDVARASCLALGDTDTRRRLAEAWAPLLAELAPDDGPPSPYVGAILGSLTFALAVGATTFAIRKDRAEAKPS